MWPGRGGGTWSWAGRGQVGGSSSGVRSNLRHSGFLGLRPSAHTAALHLCATEGCFHWERWGKGYTQPHTWKILDMNVAYNPDDVPQCYYYRSTFYINPSIPITCYVPVLLYASSWTWMSGCGDLRTAPCLFRLSGPYLLCVYSWTDSGKTHLPCYYLWIHISNFKQTLLSCLVDIAHSVQASLTIHIKFHLKFWPWS